VLCALLSPSTTTGQAPPPSFPDAVGLRWDIQLSEIDLDPPPAVDVIEIDGGDATADDVDHLHDAGVTVICYINAGAWEDWRDDAGLYPEEILGNEYPGWPGERFVDIRELETLGPILEARLDTCTEKGFDAVDPDNVDTWQADTGFDLTEFDQIRFNQWLAAEAHARGLAIGQKNAPELAAALVDGFDFAVTEDCLIDGWCEEMRPYADAGKPVLMVEYTDRNLDIDEICALAGESFGALVIKRRELDVWSMHCP
jgi:hypothetical protein